MLIIFKTILILTVINFGIGIIAGMVLKIKSQSFVMTSFLGIISITFLETLIAFFHPLNFYTEIIFLILGAAGFLIYIKERNFLCFDFRKNLNYWFYFFVFIIVFSSSFSPYLYDHYSYYLPTISYLRDAGFVRGISSLDLLLGQTSFWHIFQAGFSNIIDAGLRINSYLLILFLIYIYEKRQWSLLIFLPFFLLFAQQPSPDLPLFIIVLIVINELISSDNESVILYLSLFAFCIKPIVFWLPLLLILYDFRSRRIDLKQIIAIFGFGVLVVVKNLWLFGFPVFPISFLDFNLPWKPSREILTYSSQIGLMKSYDMKYSYQQILDFNLWERISHWFRVGYKNCLNVGIIISLLIIAVFAFKKRNRFYYLLLICVTLKFILIILFSAQYRFFIDDYLIAVFIIFKAVSERKSILISVFFSIAICTVFTFPGFVKGRFHMGKWMSGFQFSQLIKPAEFKTETSKPYQLGNLKFNAVKGLIAKTPYPALSLYWLKTYQYYQIFPQVSDNGFIQKKLTEKEKIELQKIINDLESSKL